MAEEPPVFDWPQSSRELVVWRSIGRRPRFFLRDDDAVSDTPALQRLFGLCRRHGVPLMLAAIPVYADQSLAHLVRDEPLVTVAVHGYAHANHAPFGQKPSELGIDRPTDEVIGELRKGREKLLAQLGGRLSGLLVPPWNRIHAEIAIRIGEAGFAGISAHGREDTPGSVATVHCNVDLIHWSVGRAGRTLEWLDAEIARALAEAREDQSAAVGILAHHLAHDDAAWRALEAIFTRFTASEVEWVAADALLHLETQA